MDWRAHKKLTSVKLHFRFEEKSLLLKKKVSIDSLFIQIKKFYTFDWGKVQKICVSTKFLFRSLLTDNIVGSKIIFSFSSQDHYNYMFAIWVVRKSSHLILFLFSFLLKFLTRIGIEHKQRYEIYQRYVIYVHSFPFISFLRSINQAAAY